MQDSVSLQVKGCPVVLPLLFSRDFCDCWVPGVRWCSSSYVRKIRDSIFQLCGWRLSGFSPLNFFSSLDMSYEVAFAPEAQSRSRMRDCLVQCLFLHIPNVSFHFPNVPSAAVKVVPSTCRPVFKGFPCLLGPGGVVCWGSLYVKRIRTVIFYSAACLLKLHLPRSGASAVTG